MKLAFAGSPEFGALVLEELLALGKTPEVVLTQPDRPRGRGRNMAPTAVARAADALGIPCERVADINADTVRSLLASLEVEALVVASFGQILRAPLLAAFECLNVHASLLPKYRGASPIQAALRAGEPSTGVSIMRMVEALDAGPVALMRQVSLSLHDDAGVVERLLALLGAGAMVQVLDALEEGVARFEPQAGESSFTTKLSPADRAFDPMQTALSCHNLVRSLSPRIGASAQTGTLRLKIWRTWPFGQGTLEPVPAEAATAAGAPGAVALVGDRLFVGCGEGAVQVLSIQPEGKQRMPAAAFLRGYGRRLEAPILAPSAVRGEHPR